jgi:hypothetical protein
MLGRSRRWAWLSLGVAAVTLSSCTQTTAAIYPAPLFDIARNPLVVSSPPRDGGIHVLDKDGTAWAVVAWVTADGRTCYGDVTASQPQGQVSCMTMRGGYQGRGSPSLLLKPVLMPVDGSIIGVGFTSGAISAVRVTVFGETATAKVIGLSGGASAAGAYALPVPMRNGQVGWADISAVTGYGASHTPIST